MKKYFLGIVAVLAAIGFSAFSPEANKVKNGLTTFYAVKQSENNWTWQESVGSRSCLPESGGPTCSFDAISAPAPNSFPDGVGNELYK